ncbi:hypothetical protein LMG24235_08515 [Paraburkholderia sabiae]|nr:hypothetical protein LMG24235_08515 [Paraburkholderia sabiae]
MLLVLVNLARPVNGEREPCLIPICVADVVCGCGGEGNDETGVVARASDATQLPASSVLVVPFKAIFRGKTSAEWEVALWSRPRNAQLPPQRTLVAYGIPARASSGTRPQSASNYSLYANAKRFFKIVRGVPASSIRRSNGIPPAVLATPDANVEAANDRIVFRPTVLSAGNSRGGGQERRRDDVATCRRHERLKPDAGTPHCVLSFAAYK